jgi:hypothetical protein
MSWKRRDNKPFLSFDEEEFFEPGEANTNGYPVSNHSQFETSSSNEVIEREEANANGHSIFLYSSQLDNNSYVEEIWEPTPTNETLQDLEKLKEYNASISVDSETDNSSLEIDEPRGESVNGNSAILSSQLETNTSEDDDWLEPPGTSEDNGWEIPVTSDNDKEDLVEPPGNPDDGEEDFVEQPATSEDDEWWEKTGDNFSKIIPKAAGFFQDDNGENSPMRVGSFAALIAAVLLGWLTIGGNATAAEAELTYGLLAAAFGTKTVIKFSTSRI